MPKERDTLYPDWWRCVFVVQISYFLLLLTKHILNNVADAKRAVILSEVKTPAPNS
jgi:hypothetical protein